MRDYLRVKDITILTSCRYNKKTNQIEFPPGVPNNVVYAAGRKGIYTLDIVGLFQRATKNTNRAKGALVARSLFALLIGIAVFFSDYHYFSLNILTLLGGILLGIYIIAVIVYTIRILSRKVIVSSRWPADLVIAWPQITNISVTESQSLNSSATIGSWYITTADGRSIIIPNVDNPYQKLDLIKKKYGYNIKF
ncbi:conjugative plasmid protein (pARN3) [Sulfolobales archaeon HS-7]|nr:conjugative plasmid protein (pARN3) [Sulfolobales archaeon HS-7]